MFRVASKNPKGYDTFMLGAYDIILTPILALGLKKTKYV